MFPPKPPLASVGWNTSSRLKIVLREWFKKFHPHVGFAMRMLVQAPTAGGCLNEMMTEHMGKARIKASQSQLVSDLNDCYNCCPRWDERTIPEVEGDAYKRLVK